jgi:hypothetical protein
MQFDTIYEKLLNGLAKGKSLEDIANKHNTSIEELKKELEKGMKVEKEHTDSHSVAKEIAMDHLVEDPKYYTKIAKAKL